MEIRHYLQILERRKWIVIVVTAVTVAVVGAASFMMPPVYSASALVRIAQVQDRDISYYDLNYSERLMNTYVQLLRTRPFLEEVIQRLGLNMSPEDLGQSTKVEALANTELLEITAQSTDPAQAMAIANTLGALLVEQRANLYTGSGRSQLEILQDQLTVVEEDLARDRASLQSLLDRGADLEQPGTAQDLNSRIQTQEQTYAMLLNEYEQARLAEAARASSVSIVEPAVLPDTPVEPRVALNIALGLVVGLVGGIGLAFLLENLDQSIYSADDLERRAEIPFLGSVPSLRVPRRLRGQALLLRHDGQSWAGEAFRVLMSNVLSPGSGRPPRTLLVASVEAGAGKSTVLANLAVALAQSGRKVIAVDSDFRSPCLHRVFDVPDGLGLSNVIFERGKLASALQETEIPGVRVLASGPLPPNPAELLGLARTRQLIGELANGVDMVLLDSPPLLEFADAVVLAPMVDGVVLVAARGKSAGRRIQKALRQLDKVGAKSIGVVFNKAEAGDGV
jgi:capsular exopolysaccharide synthesis family protein